jgi:hypothetical protein
MFVVLVLCGANLGVFIEVETSRDVGKLEFMTGNTTFLENAIHKQQRHRHCVQRSTNAPNRWGWEDR